MDDRDDRPGGLDNDLDETLEETFPASDAPANTVETAVRIAPPKPTAPPVHDNAAEHQFEIKADGEMAFLVYRRTVDSLILVHTDVPNAWRGRGIGNLLVETALAAARRDGLRIIAQCPFARAYLEKHPQG